MEECQARATLQQRAGAHKGALSYLSGRERGSCAEEVQWEGVHVMRSGQDFSVLFRPVSLSLIPTLSLALPLVTCLTLQFNCKSDQQSVNPKAGPVIGSADRLICVITIDRIE